MAGGARHGGLMNALPAAPLWRLTLARAAAWALLLTGWIGLGSLALPLAPNALVMFALVATWLLMLGAVATIATRGDLPPWLRLIALALAACATAAGVWGAAHGTGLTAVVLAVLGWATSTALASGVVRSLRLAHPVPPGPPIAAASVGAACAALVLGDVGDLHALAWRLITFVAAVTVTLMALQARVRMRSRAPSCRAGLFDCSLPAWPAGAWRDPLQWPTLLAGLAMLPMMAALPLMADWCRAQSVPPPAMVALHLAPMFGPVLLLRRAIGRWSPWRLSAVCAALLVAGAAIVAWAAAPWDLLGLALTHGAAWGLAWGGQLWAPARRGQQGTSPLRAAAGYAVLTLAVGAVVERFGARGMQGVHALLGLTAALAWLAMLARTRWVDPDATPPLPPPRVR
jgi:hypothetical protein